MLGLLGLIMDYNFVFQPLSSDHRSTATVQICSGSVNLRGDVKCRAFIHSSRPKVKDAVQVRVTAMKKWKQLSTILNPRNLLSFYFNFMIINLILINEVLIAFKIFMCRLSIWV